MTVRQHESKRSYAHRVWTISIAGIAVLLIATAFIAYLRQFGTEFPDTQDKWGQFGDYMGGTLNPLLSFVGLIALLRTLALQNTQLELGRLSLRQSQEELALTRSELQRSASAQERAALLLAEQTSSAAVTAKLAALKSSYTLVSTLLSDWEKNPPDSIRTEEGRERLRHLIDIKSTISMQMYQISLDLCGTRSAFDEVKSPAG